jgi:hypothetical protein
MITLKLISRTLPCFSLLVLVAASGCGKNPYFEDDEGAPRQSGSLTGGHPDSLSQPYVQGTKVKITARFEDQTATNTWQVKSDNPAVLSVDKFEFDSNNRIIADCTAVAAGDTTLRAIDETGAERRSAAISVGVPDSVKLYAQGLVRVLGQTEAETAPAEVEEARILTGNKGVFAVLYYRGGQRLYGRGVIQYDPLTQLTIENQTVSGASCNEFLFIKPLADGSYTMALRAGTTPLRTLPVFGVPESTVQTLMLKPEQVMSPSADQQIWVLAQARDASGRDVQGFYVSFTLGGVAQVGQNNNTAQTTGDLYRYNYAASAAQDLVATRGALRATLSVPASKGYVADTTYLGCSLSLHRGARSASGRGLALLLALFGLLFFRRRFSGGRGVWYRGQPAAR